MIALRQPDEIATWHLVFYRDRVGWRRFVPGRFTHVAAFAWSESCRTWIVLDTHLVGTRVVLLPPTDDATAWVSNWTGTGAILRLKAKPRARFWRFGFYCVPAMAHLVGVRGALLPDGLWRSCRRAGAEIIADGEQPLLHAAGAGDAGRPGARAAA